MKFLSCDISEGASACEKSALFSMDLNTRLDYAIFQLTPTRTRCDLLVFARGVCEKLASGLLEPFLSHLRLAKDQIAKGGYSITLRPNTEHSPWFTRSTLERFVRFVSTPEILERFASVEREVSHIESSIQLNGLSSSLASNPIRAAHIGEGHTKDINGVAKSSIIPCKSKGESNVIEAGMEENSKIQLHRVLETRMAVLRKEQAMAYARASVAGFEERHIDDLITFADSFGASRLREACVNFKEICKKKQGDGLWMDELAAVEACSQSEQSYMGTSKIMLTSEQTFSHGSLANVQMNKASEGQQRQSGSSDASTANSTSNHGNSNDSEGNNERASNQTQMPIAWPNVPPQYMYNLQRTSVPQMHPYHGYSFAGINEVPLCYPGNSCNIQLSPHMEELGFNNHQSDGYRRHNNLRRKDKSKVTGRISAEFDNGSTSSSSESDAEQKDCPYDENSSTVKKQSKTNYKTKSRMVVIRNINYISSKKSEGDASETFGEPSFEDDLFDGASIKQKVEDVVGSLQRHQKSNQRRSKRRNECKYPGDVNFSKDAGEPCAQKFEDVKGQNWSAFQNLLMKNEEPASSEVEHDKINNSLKSKNEHLVDVQDEYCVIRRPKMVHPSDTVRTSDTESNKVPTPLLLSTDSLIFNGRNGDIISKSHLENFECEESNCRSLVESNFTDGELILSQRMADDRNDQNSLHNIDLESSSIVKSNKGEDWFTITPRKSADKEATEECSLYAGLGISDDHHYTERNQSDFLIDDSFVIPDRGVFDDQAVSQWRTDISIETDLETIGQPGNFASNHTTNNHGLSDACEPDDLCMVLGRELVFEPVSESWNLEIDSIDINKDSNEEENGYVESIDDELTSMDKIKSIKDDSFTKTNLSSKNGRPKALYCSLTKSRSESIVKNKRPTVMSREEIIKIKKEKEEANRKKMEELMIQRQKRIAQRSAAHCTAPEKSKIGKSDSKLATKQTRNEKQTPRPPVQEKKRANVHKSNASSFTKEQPLPRPDKSKGSVPQKSTQKNIICKNGDCVVTNQSKEVKCMPQIGSGSLPMKSSNIDQIISQPTSSPDEPSKCNPQIGCDSLAMKSSNVDQIINQPTSLPDEPSKKESKSMSTNNSSDSNSISVHNISDAMEEATCFGPQETSYCNATVMNCSQLGCQHDPFSSLKPNLSLQGSPQESFRRNNSNVNFVNSPKHTEELGLASSKEPESIDYEGSANVPFSTAKSSSQFEQDKPDPQVLSLLENESVTESLLSLSSSQMQQIPAISEPKVLPSFAEKIIDTVDTVEDERGTAHVSYPVKCEISESEIISDSFESTPPPINGIDIETPYSRKKWSHNEDHLATKGIKKLLMFGRKSRNTAAF